MRVRPTVTQPKCKLCSHVERAKIDALLLLRSQRKIRPDDLTQQLLDLGVVNPTVENIKTHWKKHCEVVNEETAAAQEQASSLLYDEFFDEHGLLRPDKDFNDWIIAAGAAESAAKFRVEGRTGVTVDQALKAIEVKHRTRQSEAATDLLKALGSGVTAAHRRLESGHEYPALPPADVELDDSDAEELEP